MPNKQICIMIEALCTDLINDLGTMDINHLHSKFSQGISWNAFSYAIYKVLFTILSFLLFTRLSTVDFALWANLNSIIFLSLLWLDGGLRKSVPRFSPEFSKDSFEHRKFIIRIIGFQVALLLIALPVFWYAMPFLTNILSLSVEKNIFYYAAGIFFLEGLVGILRLIYHAHFWHKPFNSMNTIITTIEMGTIIFLLLCTQIPVTLEMIFALKVASSAVIAIIGIVMLSYLSRENSAATGQELHTQTLYKNFVQHTALMWASSSIKSLSERNFMVPLFTFTLGPAAANIYKIANDGALLFHRSVLKTIGSTDTSLLAHVRANPSLMHEMPFFFKTLTKKVATLCLITLSLFIILAPYSIKITTEAVVYPLLIIITISHLIELLLSPYERYLEVDRHYFLLFISYLPYLATVALIIGCQHVKWIGLMSTIVILHSARITGAMLMYFWAKRSLYK